MVKLQHLFLLMAPFVLIALYHHISFTRTVAGSLAGVPRMSLIGAGRRRGGASAAWRPPIDESVFEPIAPIEEPEAAAADITAAEDEAPPVEHVLEPLVKAMPVAADASREGAVAAEPQDGEGAAAAAAAAPMRRVLETEHYDPYLPPLSSAEPDPSADWPAPTLSPKKLLDGSKNWLPVPDAEGAAPSDLAWRSGMKPGTKPPHCPPGRRPYHTILTAQASTYQEWQTKIMHYHFRKVQASNPCTEMTGFTRLLGALAALEPDAQRSLLWPRPE